MPVYSEADLVVPAVVIIAASPEGISTTDLSKQLRNRLEPSGEDLELLDGRGDDKFSQKVRNLKSHNTFEKKGLATYVNGKYFITVYVDIGGNTRAILAIMTEFGRRNIKTIWSPQSWQIAGSFRGAPVPP